MNLLDARLAYDIKQLQNFAEDTFLEAYNLNEEINKYRYPLDIFPITAFDEVLVSQSYLTIYNYLITNCTYLFEDFYTATEIEILAVYLISIGAVPYDGYNYDTFLVSALERLVIATTDKEEIQFCIDEFKYKLLMYYIMHRMNAETVSQYFTELDAIEEAHNHIVLFGEKLPQYRPENQP